MVVPNARAARQKDSPQRHKGTEKNPEEMDVSTERAGVDFLPPVLWGSVVSHMRYANEDLTSADKGTYAWQSMKSGRFCGEPETFYSGSFSAVCSTYGFISSSACF